MTKYVNYRKIYEEYYGKIPTDNDGNTFEIHHIDGNRSNNSPSNLKAVSLQEHYDIHYSQGDQGACFMIGRRMQTPPDTMKEIRCEAQQERVRNGTHHFLGGEIQRESNLKRVADGTHHFLGPESNLKRVADGTHNFLDKQKASERNLKRVADGTHHWLGGEIQRNLWKEDGVFSEPFICSHCGGRGKGPIFFKIHNDCKEQFHNFFHKDYGIFYGTRYNLIDNFPNQKLSIRKLGNIIKNNVLTHRGWKIINET